ncbi:threonine/homoserine/homoserine lactone efflux protein [Herpetosiphon giganteus]|nr:LysE family transporter [Herpetosiphon giganteus]MBM7841921.1 threonine/homoserine/homoserine lactone efflux protein [Herpetosiphon giganteus]
MAMLLKGLILGFSIAAPVGPIGVLCIRRSLVHGRLAGFLSGLGAATADGLYGLLAAFGLAAALNNVNQASGWLVGLRIVGGLFLGYLAIKTMLSRPARAAATAQADNLWAMYASTLFLTLTNPMTILSFATVFAGLGITAYGWDSVWLVVGVTLGSALWWLLLSGGVSLLRERVQGYTIWINRISGLVILGFALVVLLG